MARRRGRRNRHKGFTPMRDGTFTVPSIEDVAAGAGVDVATARESIHELAAAGWLSIDGIPDDDRAPLRVRLTLPERVR